MCRYYYARIRELEYYLIVIGHVDIALYDLIKYVMLCLLSSMVMNS